MAAPNLRADRAIALLERYAQRPRLAYRILIALAAIAVATTARFWLERELHISHTFIVYFPVIALISMVCGLRISLISSLLICAIIAFLFMEPRFSLKVHSKADLISLYIFVITSMAFAVLLEFVNIAQNYIVKMQTGMSERQRAEEALRASEERYRSLVEQAVDGIFLADETGRYLDANSAGLQMFGYSLDELRALTLSDLVVPEEVPRMPGQMASLDDGAVVRSHWRFRRKDGSTFFGEVLGRRLPDGRLLGILRDTTERDRAEAALRASERRFRAIFNHQFQYSVLLSPDGRILELSESITEGTGVTPPEVIGTTFIDGPWWRDLPEMRAKWRRLMETAAARPGPARGEMAYRTKDGALRHALNTVTALRDALGDIEYLLAEGIDITERKRMEEAMRQRDQDFARAQEVGQIGWWRLDTRKNVLTWSDETYRIFGIPAGTPQTYENFLSIVHPDDRDFVNSRWMASLTGAPYDIEHRILVGGAMKWVREKAYLEFGEDGALLGGFGVTQDVTERVRAGEALRESQRQLALALEAGQLGFWDWDVPSGRVQFGGRWASMLGYDPGETEPHLRAWETLVHPDEREAVAATLADHLEGRAAIYECEHRLRHKDGTWRWILDRGQVVTRDAEGRPLRAIGTHSDVTARHEAVEALREADRRKDEFLATLAHELRNPLAPIHNGVHILEASARQRDGEADLRVLEMMKRQVGALVRLVDDLLVIARITSGKIELRREPVDLDAILRIALETSQPFIEKGGHAVDVDAAPEPLRVDGDKTRLAQALTNLINNAVKYTPQGGHIEIRLKREDGKGVIAVRDNGRGIAAEALPHVFDLFAQAGRAVDEGGLGIGLALVRKLVQLHGGDIEARSEGPGKGSEFLVRLPLLPVETAPGAAAPVLPSAIPLDFPPASQPALPLAPATRQRALVIDDDHDVADALALLLESLGATVRVAYDGAAGAVEVANFNPEIVFLDLGMPVLDGFETARRIKRAALRQPKLVALSGWGQEEDRRKTREAGFDAHLTKPASVKALQELLSGQGRGDG